MVTFGTLYDTVMARLKLVEIGASFAVTLKTLSLGTANSTTGHYLETYSEGTTIEMLIVTRATQNTLIGIGCYVRRDALGFTRSVVAVGDAVVQGSLVYFISAVRPHAVGDALVTYEVDLIYQPNP
jgi:hypothetical protein